MKKWTLLLLILALCLSLAACELPFGKRQQLQDYTALFSLLEENRFDEALVMFRQIRKGEMPAEKGMMDADNLKAKYSEMNLDLNVGNYDRVLNAIMKQAADHFSKNILGQNGGAAQELVRGWYEVLDNPDFTEDVLCIELNGTAILPRYSQNVYWVVKESSYRQLVLQTYWQDTLEDAGTITLTTEDGYPFMVYRQLDQDGKETFLSYVTAPLLSGAYAEWFTPDTQDGMFPAEISIEGHSVLIGDVYYTLQQAKDDLQVVDQNGTVLYSLRLRLGKGELRYLDVISDQGQAVYYQPGAEYEELVDGTPDVP